MNSLALLRCVSYSDECSVLRVCTVGVYNCGVFVSLPLLGDYSTVTAFVTEAVR